MSLPSGGGALFTTEVEYADLGTHGGRRLRGRVERRLLQIAVGDRGGLRVRIGRMRPVAVEVVEPDERRHEVPIVAPPDPWIAAGRRMVLVWLAAALVVGAARSLRRSRTMSDGAGGTRGAD